MPFPFMSLPCELRNLVYHFSFTTTEPEIYPDPTSSLARHRLIPESVFQVALLRTCRIVHEEASATLYGTKIFCFSDKESLCCAIMIDFERDEVLSEGSWDTVHDSSITGMYIFFRLIGTKNRLRIRHLSITVTDFRLCYYPNEYRSKKSHGGTHRLDGRTHFYEEDALHFGKEHSAGHLIGDTFELLSRGHNLQTLRIILDCGDEPEKMPIHFLRNIEKSKSLRQIAEVKGLSRVTVQTLPKKYAFQMRVFAILEKEMMKPKATLSYVDNKLNPETSIQRRAAALCEKITAMADEHQELTIWQNDGSRCDGLNLRIKTIEQVFKQLSPLID